MPEKENYNHEAPRPRRKPYHARLTQITKSAPRRQKNRGRSNRNSPNKRAGFARLSPENQTTKIPTKIPPIGNNIRVIPLGGVEEVGRNMTAIEYKDDIIVVDAGIQFGTEATPGVDYVLPNTAYLKERKDRIKALIITHGHLDHIGAIPHIIKDLGNPPIYSMEFGAMLIKKRQLEYPHLPPLNIKIIGKNDGAVPISNNLKIKFFGLTHSIPDSSGVIIETPLGDVVMTGDVRIENENGVPHEKENKQYEIFKNRSVLLLAMDSTGSYKPGWALSEEKVVQNVDELIKLSKGRVIVATFASQVERIIGFINSAKKYGRKVVIDGRSMKTNIEIIKQLRLGEVKHAIPLEEISDYPPNRVMVIATGAQGEEFASLMRISNGTHKYIKLSPTDTVILSSSVIPGNERAIIALKDNLYRHDVQVITYNDSDVHTSGHGKRGELEWIHKKIKYRFFMPVHGYHFMLKTHAEMARNLGTPRENIIVPDNGSVVEIYDSGQKIRMLKEKVPANPIMVDGFSVGDIQEVVIRDRVMLAQDGMFVIIASVNLATGRLKKSPDIISRGFVYLRESQELLQQTRLIIKKTIEDNTAGMKPINFDYVKEILTDNVSRFLFQKTAKRPMVIPVLIGI